MPPAAPSRRLLGIALMVAAGLFFTILDSCAKWLVRELPTVEIVWARYASSLLFVLPFVNPWTVPALRAPRRPGLQIARALVVLASTGLNFVALQFLQLDQTVSINFSTPLIVAVLAGPLLGEWIGWRRGLVVLAGFGGVLVVTQPGFSGFHWAMLLCVAGAFVYAGGNILARVLVREDSPAVALFYLSAGGAVLLLPAIPPVWQAPPHAVAWLLMAAMGAAGAVGHYCLILAHKHAPASTVAPFIYTQLVWMALSGWLVFGTVPDHATLVGAGIVIASGVLLVLQERRA